MFALWRRLTGAARAARVIALLLLANSCGAQRVFGPSEFRMRLGDDPRWANIDLADQNWQPLQLYEVPDSDGIVLLRGQLEVPAAAREQPLAIYFAALAACEMAWDGERIGQSGIPGATPATERPGPLESIWPVPERLATPGMHHIALRCSAQHRHFQPAVGYWGLAAGPYDALLSASRGNVLIALSSLSGMLIVGIYAFCMYCGDRRERAFLLLAGLCLAGGCLLLAESWRALVGYSYNWHLLRLLVITSLTALLNLALLGFVTSRHPGRGRRAVLLVLVCALLLALGVNGWDGKAAAMFAAGFCLALGWMLRAVWQRQRGSVLALLGVLAAWIALFVEPARFADLTLYLALDLLLACLLISHTLQLGQIRRGYEAALLQSTRLQAELLRRHIQPHFLMNTLTALSEWIEQEPTTAVQMIELLAAEFRILSRVADRPLIALGEELELCQTHVAIMSRRIDRQYTLEISGVDPQQQVPPALFHTLVENAISHDDCAHNPTRLRLSAQCDDRHWSYVFEAPSATPRYPPVEGSGLRYVRARLQESFADDWTLQIEAIDGVWRTRLRLPART